MARKTLLVCSVALCLLPALALGQAVPVAPPPSPARSVANPSDFRAPGRSPPAAARAARLSAAASSGKAAPAGSPGGYSGGDYVIGGARPSLYGEAPQFRSDIPEYHVVKDKDTLWTLCGYYYGDPWMWPKLWAHNKSITNPHWIYPGDKIRMIGGRPLAVRAGEEGIVAGGGRRYAAGDIVLRQQGFVDQNDLNKAGKIVGSKRESLMLTTHQEVYLKGGEKFKPQVGKSYTIYRVNRKLESGDRVYGQIVDLLGTLRVKKINKHNVATAEITDAIKVIERGHLVGPLRRTFKRLAVRPSKVDLEARLIETYRPNWKHVASDELVFVDRGRKHGVHLGNRFLVVRRGDGYRKVIVDKEKDNPSFPYEVVGEIAVLDLRDEFCVGVIARTTKELRVGELLRLRRGY